MKPMSALFAPGLVLKVLWLLLRERLGLVALPQPPQQAAAAAGPAAAAAAAEASHAVDEAGSRRQHGGAQAAPDV